MSLASNASFPSGGRLGRRRSRSSTGLVFSSAFAIGFAALIVGLAAFSLQRTARVTGSDGAAQKASAVFRMIIEKPRGGRIDLVRRIRFCGAAKILAARRIGAGRRFLSRDSVADGRTTRHCEPRAEIDASADGRSNGWTDGCDDRGLADRDPSVEAGRGVEPSGLTFSGAGSGCRDNGCGLGSDGADRRRIASADGNSADGNSGVRAAGDAQRFGARRLLRGLSRGPVERSCSARSAA